MSCRLLHTVLQILRCPLRSREHEALHFPEGLHLRRRLRLRCKHPRSRSGTSSLLLQLLRSRRLHPESLPVPRPFPVLRPSQLLPQFLLPLRSRLLHSRTPLRSAALRYSDLRSQLRIHPSDRSYRAKCSRLRQCLLPIPDCQHHLQLPYKSLLRLPHRGQLQIRCQHGLHCHRRLRQRTGYRLLLRQQPVRRYQLPSEQPPMHKHLRPGGFRSPELLHNADRRIRTSRSTHRKDCHTMHHSGCNPSWSRHRLRYGSSFHSPHSQPDSLQLPEHFLHNCRSAQLEG